MRRGRPEGVTLSLPFAVGILLACAVAILGSPGRSVDAKALVPDYLVVLLPDGPVELSRDQLEGWLADAERTESSAPAVRPAAAIDAVGFWGRTTLTQEERLAFASSGAGREHAGWWAPEESGGTILFRSQFGTVGGTAPLVQEYMYRTERPLPVETTLPRANAEQHGETSWWLPVASILGIGLLIGAILWRTRLRHKTTTGGV